MPDRLDAISAAVAFRRENPEAYSKMLGWARDDMARGRHASIRFYSELLRREEFHGIESAGAYLIDNRILGALARLLIQDDPKLASVMRLRYSPLLDEPGTPNARPRPRRIAVD